VDALMAALVVAPLSQIGDRTAWRAAILSDRFARPLMVAAMATLAIALASGAAAYAGSLLAPRLAPEPRQVFFGLSLVFLGGGALFAVKRPDGLERWRIGGAATSLLGVTILAFGNGLQFVVLAVAARAALPWLAALGATLGSMVVLVPAVLLGERGWCALPLRRIRIVTAMLFIAAGLAYGLDGIGLV
jgi:putative Ca2+/H+ antiporter (TMEM165/GDT1 family)